MPTNQDGTQAPVSDDEDIAQQRGRRPNESQQDYQERKRRDAEKARKERERKRREAKKREDKQKYRAELKAEQKALYPWAPDWMVNAYVGAYIEHGSNQELALAAVREHVNYDKFFVGNRRPDGSFRYDEGTYMAVRTGYDERLKNMGVNPRNFRDEYGKLIEGGVSPAEWGARLDAINQRVLLQAPAIKQYYAENFGIDLNRGAILASVLKPQLGQDILNRQISIAEVGGEAAQAGFDLDFEDAVKLYNRSYGRGQALELFKQASADIPMFSALMERHLNRNNDFDLNTFLSAAAYNDQGELARMRNALQSESALFSDQGLLAVEEGMVGGLATR